MSGRREEPAAAGGTPPGHLPALLVPALLAAIAVAIVGAFYVGGPGLGLAAGGLAAGTIVFMAVRKPPRGPIWPAPLRNFRRHVLVVLEAPLEDGAEVARIATRSAGEEGPEPGAAAGERPEPDVLLLAPAHCGFLDRWSCDRRRSYAAAERNLVMGVAALAKARLPARARLGDEDTVQAVEDALRTYPATDVVLVSEAAGADPRAAAAAAELRRRLRTDFLHLVREPVAAVSAAAPARPPRRHRN